MSTPFPPPGYVPLKSAVEGIHVFGPAPQDSGPDQPVVDFTCPQCGATTAFSAADRGLTCTHCGYYEPPHQEVLGRRADEFEFTVATMDRAAQGWGIPRTEITCQNCGAAVSLPPDHLTFTCAFCGSNKVIQHASRQDILRPRYVAPFLIQPSNCAEIARKWLGSSWMVPADLRSGARLAEFTGLYLPYWTFDADAHGKWKAEVGHTRTERYYQNGEWKERSVTVWRWEYGDATQKFDDLLIPGTQRVSINLLSQVEAFDLNALVAYSPEFLAGFQAQAYETPLEIAWDAGRRVMRDRTRSACQEQASSSQIRNFSMSLDFANESWRYVLLPVYLAAYTYGDKTYQAVINGQTGAAAGQRPVDWNKLRLVIAALVAPGLLLGLLGLVTIPLGGAGVAIGGFGFILLVIGVILSIILAVRAGRMDDL